GCDASILINSTSNKPSEKTAGPNLTVRGYELIDEAKRRLEAACPSKVSCADIITLATRDSVILAGGPDYAVPTGRRDGLISNPDEVNLPGPDQSITSAFAAFKDNGMTLNEMVALLGAHTVGFAHCNFFSDRLSNFQGTGKPDPAMDPNLVTKLKALCAVGSDPKVFLDQNTSNIFDNEFYRQIRLKRGVLKIDQELATDPTSSRYVANLASNPRLFSRDFGNAMTKMGRIATVGSAGEIRKNCAVFNPRPKSLISSVLDIAEKIIDPYCCVFAQLTPFFYRVSCPKAERVVKQVVLEAFQKDSSITAGLLRMHFHDCFVRGCDASILVNSTSKKPSEKDAGPNLTVRGYELIDEAKRRLEIICPSQVSCADIITLATRDSVVLAGGPNYAVPTGRRDGLISNPDEVNLPGPDESITSAFATFKDNGMTLNEMVALLGAHTVGFAHCNFFSDRLSNFQGTGKPDPTMDPKLVTKLKALCAVGSAPKVFLDQNTSNVFDNEFYRQIRLKRGVLKIDQELATDPASSRYVSTLASNPALFSKDFGNAMTKMGRIATVGKEGEIRKNCAVFNPRPKSLISSVVDIVEEIIE
ncbi:hypothetical protein G4B88_008904, partial [Cannabis sativa]